MEPLKVKKLKEILKNAPDDVDVIVAGDKFYTAVYCEQGIIDEMNEDFYPGYEAFKTRMYLNYNITNQEILDLHCQKYRRIFLIS